MKIAVVNLKGGTAKTTTSLFFAQAFSGVGKTLLVDADPQGSAMTWTEEAMAEGHDFPFTIVALPVKDIHRKLPKMAADYDHVVVDTPPGDTEISVSALKAVEVALLVLQPSWADMSRFNPTLDLIAEADLINEDLVYYVMLARSPRISRDGRDARLAMGEMELPLLHTEIPQLSFYYRAFGQPIGDLGEYANAVNELIALETEEVSR